MAINTYATLQQAVLDWVNDPAIEQSVPTFIGLAEARFNRELRMRDMLNRSSATSTAEFFTLPADWLQTYSLELAVDSTTTDPALKYIGVDEAKQYKANHMRGRPRYFTQINNTVELVPAPQDNANLLLTYYAAIPALSDTQTTNWLLTKAPDAYLYAALLQAGPYLQKQDQIQLWEGALSKILSDLYMDSERAMRPTVQLMARRRGFF